MSRSRSAPGGEPGREHQIRPGAVDRLQGVEPQHGAAHRPRGRRQRAAGAARGRSCAREIGHAPESLATTVSSGAARRSAPARKRPRQRPRGCAAIPDARSTLRAGGRNSRVGSRYKGPRGSSSQRSWQLPRGSCARVGVQRAGRGQSAPAGASPEQACQLVAGVRSARQSGLIGAAVRTQYRRVVSSGASFRVFAATAVRHDRGPLRKAPDLTSTQARKQCPAAMPTAKATHRPTAAGERG